MRYIESAFWHFLVFFIGAFITIMMMQLFNTALDWYGGNTPDPISFVFAAKAAFIPSLIYGIYGIYNEWDVIRQSKKPPRKRHPHD